MMKKRIGIAAALGVLLAVLTLAAGCGVRPDHPEGNATAASGTDVPELTAPPTAGIGNGPAEIHNAAADVYNYVEGLADNAPDGIYAIIPEHTWLSWFGLTPEDIAAEKTQCEAAGLPFEFKVKTTPFKTVKLTEEQLEDQVRYLVLDGSDEERESLAAGTLTLWSPSEMTFGSRTVSAPMGRYKFQPLLAGELDDAAKADGGYKELVEESRTETEVVFHYVYYILGYTLSN